jgi:hypothetical protein
VTRRRNLISERFVFWRVRDEVDQTQAPRAALVPPDTGTRVFLEVFRVARGLATAPEQGHEHDRLVDRDILMRFRTKSAGCS